MMTGDKIGNKSISPNKIFKLDESDDELKDYGGSCRMKQYFLSLEQLSTTNGKTKLHLPSTAAAALSITHNSNNAPVNRNKIDESSTASAIPSKNCTKELSPSSTSTTASFLPFAGLRPFYPIHPSSYPYSLLSASTDVTSQFSPW